MRTNDRTLVTIPNGDLAAQRIENYSHRDSFLFNPTIGLSYDSKAEDTRAAVAAMRAPLRQHDAVSDEDLRVTFTDLGVSSLDIGIFALIQAHNYPASLAVREELLLAIMEAVEKLGLLVAFPTRTMHMVTTA